MAATRETGAVLKKESPANQVFSLTIYAPRIAVAACCGQFVQVLCEPFELRRPISLAGFDAQSGVIRLVIAVRGKGTRRLSQIKAGESVDLIGPLGHGFPLLEKEKQVILAGGGIGAAPLLPIARHYGEHAQAVLGFRSVGGVLLEHDFCLCGAHVCLCTDDGSAGYAGTVPQRLTELLHSRSADVIYSCGPEIMMEKTFRIAESYGIPCYVSLEEHMACGVGACLGCVRRVKAGGKEEYKRVCADGPVFSASEVFGQ